MPIGKIVQAISRKPSERRLETAVLKHATAIHRKHRNQPEKSVEENFEFLNEEKVTISTQWVGRIRDESMTNRFESSRNNGRTENLQLFMRVLFIRNLNHTAFCMLWLNGNQ